jgi:hypothetical protein
MSIPTPHPRSPSPELRQQALLILDRRGAILDIARELTRVLAAAGIPAAVIGGVAVVLHGHIRTTVDVDLLVGPPLAAVAEALTDAGFEFLPERREFVRGGIPVHLVMPDQAGPLPEVLIDLEGIRTVPLARLINMKLRTGTTQLLRAQDLADVIGLIRHHRLGGQFAAQVDRDLRAEYRKLSRAVASERGEG